MIPRNILLISFKKMVVIAIGIVVILFMTGCGGGGGGTDKGSLMVTLETESGEEIPAGAQWRRIVGDSWHNSGDIQSDLNVGTYTVEFKEVPPWTTPANQTATIIKDQTTPITGTYIGGGIGSSFTVTGKVDDGTSNSTSGWNCVIVDPIGVQHHSGTVDDQGEYKFELVPRKRVGYIRCNHPEIQKLQLSTCLNIDGLLKLESFEDFEVIPGQDVTPTTTVVADIIDSKNPDDPMRARRDLFDAIESGDTDLNALVRAKRTLFKNMLRKKINAPIDGGPGADYGGEAAGEAGDGADFSSIANASCDFALDLEGEALYYDPLEDLRDGKLDRPDLAAIKNEVEEELKDILPQIKEAIKNTFPEGVGDSISGVADEDGKYSLPLPLNVQGFVRCAPPDQPNLKLATLVPKLQEKDKRLSGQDVTPQTTVFSYSIAKKLSGDLSDVKENYLDEVAGLRVGYTTENGDITEFHVIDPETYRADEGTDGGVGLVAFSATSLFNIFYKNETDVDYPAALSDFIAKRRVDPDFLVKNLGLSKSQAEDAATIVKDSVETAEKKEVLGIDLKSALSTARIMVRVLDRGEGVQHAMVKITDAPSAVVCNDCPGETDEHGEVTLTLIQVPEDKAIQIEVEASSVAGYEPMRRTTKIVAFATVDLEMAFSHELSVQGDGTGNGAVTSVPSGISCDISGGAAGGENSEYFDADTEVILTAEKSQDSTFDGWSGDGCSGTGDCTVMMNQAHTVTATFTLRKSPCTYSILPVSQPIAAAGGTGSISVSASAGDCSWTATASESWIRIPSGSSGSGDGTVSYTVDANPLSVSRNATITVGEKTHTLTQVGRGVCTYSITPLDGSFTANGGTGSIAVDALAQDCSWEASESASWIRITSGSNGIGDGTVSYTVDRNPFSAGREATIAVAGKSHKVTQEGVGACTYSISPLDERLTANGGTGSIAVDALAQDCSWNASEDASWIRITSGSNGIGDGTVSYTVDPNPLSASREATIAVAGKSHKVVQSGVGPCTFTILPTNKTFIAEGGTGSIAVDALAQDCSWEASESASWIGITSGSSGSGDDTVSYSVSANPLSGTREATITVAGKGHKVTQAGVPCIYSISPTSKSFDGRGGLGRISVFATSDCGWNTSGVPSWIAITSGDGSGSSNDEVTYWVDENFGTSTREATITVAGKSHTVTQTPCNYSISPTSKSFPSSGGTGVIDVVSTNTCAWSVSENASWITITEVNNNSSGHFNGEVRYSVSANTDTSSRSAAITVAGKTHTVTQAPPCIYSISPETNEFPAGGGDGSITVSPSYPGCETPWAASTNATWIEVTSGRSSHGSGTVSYLVTINDSKSIRTAAITVAGKTHQITQVPFLVPPTLISPKSGAVFSYYDNITFRWNAVPGAKSYWIAIRKVLDNEPIDHATQVKDAPVSSTSYTLSPISLTYESIGKWIWAVYALNDYESERIPQLKSEIWEFYAAWGEVLD